MKPPDVRLCPVCRCVVRKETADDRICERPCPDCRAYLMTRPCAMCGKQFERVRVDTPTCGKTECRKEFYRVLNRKRRREARWLAILQDDEGMWKNDEA